ncbi:DMT family transporter [Aestuariibius sp. 2305UL40-4]|uniref:DMT family transporter n=1 Tax=Aestuariibius violaceus TaxID=3234132 RepID=UPI00345E2544
MTTITFPTASPIHRTTDGGSANESQPTPPSPKTATFVGGCAVLVWATAASFAVLGTTLPPMLFIGGAFASGFLAFLVARLLRGQPVLGMLAVPLPVLCLLVVGFLGHNGLYVTALRYAPAAQVNLISYLWPLLMVGLLAATQVAEPTPGQLAGSVLGFIGLVWFVSPGSVNGSFFGYALAFSAACCFAAYSALRAKVSGGPADAAGAACGVAAIASLFIHFAFGGSTSIEVDLMAILAMVLIGIGPMGVANLFWDYGVRYGDGRVLSTLAYLTPVLSTLLLVGLGLATLTSQVLVGGAFILGGIFLSAASGRKA